MADEFQSRWRVAFERRGALLDDDAGIAGWTSTGLATRLRGFLRVWRSREHRGLWLDIGCGAGTYTRILASEGLWMVGMDYSLPSLNKARARGGANIDWIAGDVTALPIADRTFDGILCFGVLQALSASRPALRSMGRVLKPGGELWLDALNARCIPSRARIRRDSRAGRHAHLRYDRVEDLKTAMRETGFDNVVVHWLPIMPAGLQWLQPLFEPEAARWLLRRVPVAAEAMSHSILLFGQRRSDG
ncbi:MAG: class I SAM-dependent methyltransferase [Vicinamibacterales bacterium]